MPPLITATQSYTQRNDQISKGVKLTPFLKVSTKAEHYNLSAGEQMGLDCISFTECI